MKSKRILTSLLVICFVVTAMAGIASAREIKPYGENLIGPYLWYEYSAAANTAKKSNLGQSAVIECRNPDGFIRDTGMYNWSIGDELFSSDIGNEQPNAIGDGASMTWKVQANKSGWTDITALGSISNNGRVLLATKNLVAKDLPVVCRLQAHNIHPFAIRVKGTWSPDET